MKIVFLGASSFGLRCLKEIFQIPECQVVGVVTSPQKFKISYNPKGVKNYLHESFGPFCNEKGIPLIEIEDGMRDDKIFESVVSLKPDLFIVVGWYHMVPKRWRELAPAYGMHASLLPKYSGGAPLVWSIINDEDETGITLFELSDGVDDGAILGQLSTPIFYEDDISILYKRIEELGCRLLCENLPKLKNNNASFIEQDENQRTLYPQRSPADGLIDWTKSSRDIYNFIRAQTQPYPGAFSLKDGKKIIIWKCSETNDMSTHEDIPIGSILKDEGKVYVKTGGSPVSLDLIESEKKRIAGSDIFRFFGVEQSFDQ